MNLNQQTKPLRQKRYSCESNRPQSYNILNERGNVLARNRCHLIPTTEKFNIKHDYDNAIPVSNTSID